MDASVAHGSDVKQLPASRLTDQGSADRARECLLNISQVDAASGLRDIASFDEGASEGGQKDTDQEDEYRQKLIAISYGEAVVEQSNELKNAAQADTKMKA